MICLGCSRVKPTAGIKFHKPLPPELKKIQLLESIDCKDPASTVVCDIFLNFDNLMRYICKLEANPTWGEDSQFLCPVKTDQ